MRERLALLFVSGMRLAPVAASTPRLPVTIRYNVSDDGEGDSWRCVVRLEPVTVIANGLLEVRGGADDHLHLLLAGPAQLVAMRDAQLCALAAQYAEAEAANLVDAGWSE